MLTILLFLLVKLTNKCVLHVLFQGSLTIFYIKCLMFDLFASEKFTGVTKGLGKARTLSGPVFFPAKWSVSVIAMFLVYKH